MASCSRTSNPNQLPLFVCLFAVSLIVGLFGLYLLIPVTAQEVEMAAEQRSEMLSQELVRTLIWELHGHSDGFQRQEEKETVGASEPLPGREGKNGGLEKCERGK